MRDEAAKRLRRNATEAESRLWQVLRHRQLAGAKFRRQHVIGPFIVDFACLASRLVVEADGGQHAASEDDARRTAWLEREGWQVIRFWNDEILRNPEGVMEVIARALAGTPGWPSPSQR